MNNKKEQTVQSPTIDLSAMPVLTLRASDKLYLSAQMYSNCVYTLSLPYKADVSAFDIFDAKTELHAFPDTDKAFFFYDTVEKMRSYQAQTIVGMNQINRPDVQQQIKEFERNLKAAYAEKRGREK